MGQLIKGGSGGWARSTPVRFRYLFLLATIFGGSFLILSISNGTEIFLLNNEHIGTYWNTYNYEVTNSDKSFTIKTEGCTIPGLQPFDKSIKKFIENSKHLKPCPNTNSSLLNNNETHIWIRKEILELLDIPETVNISCCYKSFYRPSAIDDISSANIDDRVKYQPCIDFSTSIEVINEFVKVSCGYDEKTIYEQYFLFTPKKPFMSNKENSNEILHNQSTYNVILMGIDAVSRLNFHRTMPKTLRYLKKKGAIELLGYNKVGDNTFPNLIPMLLGIKESDLKRTCWPNMRTTFDNCPFIWEWYKDAGYYTAFGEDSASLGTFNFEKSGFSGMPTDYYIHTFMHEAEKYVGNNKDFNSYVCMGNKYFYKVLLEYIESLTVTLINSKLFGFFWEVTMSHDYLNYPKAMDDDYENFLKSLDQSTYLDNTILILLSDHGIRWGDIRFTKQGRLEERLPFAHILLPQSFRENYSLAYDNLKQNSRSLTTPFDIHATLSDLIDLNEITNENIKRRKKTYYAQNRTISLFLPIPKNRTCQMAGIEDHWCTCHKSIKISIYTKEARQATEYLMKHLNMLIISYPQCAPLMLSEILEVREMVTEVDIQTESDQDLRDWREFMVVVRVEPGGGVYEATLRHGKYNWNVAGTVSRLNLYGKQSRCMHNYQLKLYCYCQ